MSTHSQAKVARKLLQNAEYFLSEVLPGGELTGGEYSAPNPTRDDTSPGSFKINIETGVWADFATDDSGGDLVELLAYLEGHSNGSAVKAAESFCKEHGLAAPRGRPKRAASSPTPKREKPPVEPIVEEELDELPPDFHPEHGPVTASWAYTDNQGRTLFHVLRCEGENGKQTLPCRYLESKGRWDWSRPPEVSPLFNLHKLTPGTQVCFGEGSQSRTFGPVVASRQAPRASSIV